MFVITGATGNTGSAVARTLLDAGHPVRLLVRDPGKVQHLVARGAEVVTGDLNDPGAVAQAFAGAQGLYLMSPPDVGSRNFVVERGALLQRLADSARSARIEHVVFLSSLGAELGGATGPIRTLHMGERALEATGLPVTFLRAGYFLSNWAAVLPAARQDGVLPSFLPATLRIPTIAVGDIGPAAAAALQAGPRGRRIIELCGPREVSAEDIAIVLGRQLGRSVKVVEAPLSAVVPTFTSFGISENVAGLYREMYDAFAAGRIKLNTAGSELSRGPTDLETGIKQML